MYSLYLMGDSSQMNDFEREELKRRTLMMLLYLLRSPFYDRYSKLVMFCVNACFVLMLVFPLHTPLAALKVHSTQNQPSGFLAGLNVYIFVTCLSQVAHL